MPRTPSRCSTDIIERHSCCQEAKCSTNSSLQKPVQGLKENDRVRLPACQSKAPSSGDGEQNFDIDIFLLLDLDATGAIEAIRRRRTVKDAVQKCTSYLAIFKALPVKHVASQLAFGFFSLSPVGYEVQPKKDRASSICSQRQHAISCGSLFLSVSFLSKTCCSFATCATSRTFLQRALPVRIGAVIHSAITFEYCFL